MNTSDLLCTTVVSRILTPGALNGTFMAGKRVTCQQDVQLPWPQARGSKDNNSFSGAVTLASATLGRVSPQKQKRGMDLPCFARVGRLSIVYYWRSKRGILKSAVKINAFTHTFQQYSTPRHVCDLPFIHDKAAAAPAFCWLKLRQTRETLLSESEADP